MHIVTMMETFYFPNALILWQTNLRKSFVVQDRRIFMRRIHFGHLERPEMRAKRGNIEEFFFQDSQSVAPPGP